MELVAQVATVIGTLCAIITVVITLRPSRKG